MISLSKIKQNKLYENNNVSENFTMVFVTNIQYLGAYWFPVIQFQSETNKTVQLITNNPFLFPLG